MFDFHSITGSATNQTSVYLVLFASLMTLLLSTILVIIYDKTSRQVARPDHFIQSLLLMSMVTCTIMQSIGDSLALSFGIFGALAIIRFRTRISDPRDVAFVFATMAIGIACGVHSFINGIIGTLMFCLIIIVLRFTPFGQKNKLIGSLRVMIRPGDMNILPVHQVLDQMTQEYSIKRVRVGILKDEQLYSEYEYKCVLRNDTEISAFAERIENLEDVSVSRLIFEDQNDMDVI